MPSLPITSAFNDACVVEAYEPYRRDPASQEVITESGTMYVEEMIAGVSQTAGVHVTAQPDSLRINLSGKSLDPGNTATFQATTSTTPFTVCPSA